MNTGVTIETERLFLIPGSNARDDALLYLYFETMGISVIFVGLNLEKKSSRVQELTNSLDIVFQGM